MVLGPAASWQPRGAQTSSSGQRGSMPCHGLFSVTMPIYEYQCPKCQHTFEEWVKASESHGQEPCPKCGEPSPRIMSHTSFVLKGGGWYVSDYGYRKGVTEEGGSTASSSGTSGGSSAPASGGTAGEKASAPASDSGNSAAKAAPAPTPTTGSAASAPTKAASSAS